MSAARQGAALAILGLAFAFLAVMSGLDRASFHQPAYIRLVPEAFRGEAHISIAARAFAAEDYAIAQDEARSALLASPMDSRGAAILGSAALLAGEQSQARKALALALALNPRDVMGRIYGFERALGDEDVPEAAMHLDAILQATQGSIFDPDFIDRLEALPNGRQAIARRLKSNPLWAQAYLTAEGVEPQALVDRARFLADSGSQAPVLGCAAVLPLARKLVQIRKRRMAERLWSAQCPDAEAPGTIADARFDAVGQDTASPFGWTRHNTGDVRVTSLSGEDTRVELENRSSVSRPVLSQPLGLDAGRYRVTARVVGPGERRVAATLSCDVPRRPPISADRIDEGGVTFELRDCADPLLVLWLRPGRGRVVLDRIAIEPA